MLFYIIFAVKDCKATLNGERYLGFANTTIDGTECLAWKNVTELLFENSDFLDDSVAKAGSYCRNPAPSKPGGPWCYTNDTTWAYCNTTFCREY